MGVGRIGSLEMLILSEFEASELTQSMLRMLHLASSQVFGRFTASIAWSVV